jgi:hypothetical protein
LSNTPINGSPESDAEFKSSTSTEVTHTEIEQPAASRPGIGCVLAALLAVIFALYMGLQVIGVLFSIAAPPQPPLPEDARQVEYSSTAYGVDEWVYTTQQDACRVFEYYQDLSAECSLLSNLCRTETSDASASSPLNVARCSGEVVFSIFAMRWNAVIATGYNAEEPTHFRLSREVYWTGEIPPTNFYNRQPTAVPVVP